MKLATLVSEEKNTPFVGAANVKAPLITTAALQFNSRAYPALVKGDRVTKCKVNGRDPSGDKAKRAERVSEHSSWQMLSQMPEWEPDTDRLTLIVAISGVVFRKRYFDPTLNRQCSRLVLADRFVYNYKARSIEDCPRISEELYLYPYEIQERIRDGRFIEFEYGEATADEGEETDEDSPHLFIEQHRLSDLDGDGYPEPYIVTVHVETQKVCRIVPNFDADSVRVTPEGKIAAIRKRDYYTKYVFFESPDGGAYGMGLGSLMGSTTETVNTLINEMIDAGNLANTQGGFINSNAGLRGGQKFFFSKGEFKVLNTSMDLRAAIMPISFAGPSEVLFKLLGLLMEFAKEISATADVMTGDTGGKVMAPTTTVALIEQGMQVFSAVFKRLHRALGRECVMHASLNAKYLSPEDYNAFFDDPEQQFDPKADYDLKDMNITPVSDPTVATNMQKLAKSQLIREIAGEPGSKPWINYPEIDKRAFEAAEIPDMDGLFAPQQPPDPMAEAVKKLTLQELFEKVIKLRSESIKNVADAESKEAGDQIALLNQFLSTLQAGHAMESQDNAPIPGGPGGLPGMAGAPGNAMGAGPAAPPGGGNSEPPQGPPVQQLPGAVPDGMGGSPAPSSAPTGAM
jgi:chaperonin GroES